MELDKIVTSDPDKVTTYTFHTLSLTKTAPNGKSSALRWSIRNGYPRATYVKDVKLRTEDRQARYSNYVTYPLDSIRLIAALTEWMKIIRSGKENDYVTMAIFYPRLENGITNRNFIGRLMFGVNKNVPFIGLSDGDQPPSTFYFTADTQFVEFERNGEAVNMNKELGISYAQALIRHLEGAYLKYANVFVSDKKEYTGSRDVKLEAPQPQPVSQQPAPQPVQQPVVQEQVQQPSVTMTSVEETTTPSTTEPNYEEQMMDDKIEI